MWTRSRPLTVSRGRSWPTAHQARVQRVLGARAVGRVGRVGGIQDRFAPLNVCFEHD